MKYQVVCRTDGAVEIHSRTCKEFPWDGYYSDGLVDAASPFDAAVDVLEGDERAAFDAILFPCLAPGYEPPVEGSRRGRRPTQRVVPFDLDGTDDEIITACYGKLVKWVTEIGGEEQEATLYPEGKFQNKLGYDTWPHRQTKITENPSGRRILNFIDMGGTGYRAAYLDRIVSVK